jgi:hypothetical protein
MHRHVAKPLVSPELPHEREAVDLGHHEILQDDGRMDLGRLGKSSGRILAVVERDALLAREHSPDSLADDRLVIDEKHGDAPLGRGFRGGHGDGFLAYFRSVENAITAGRLQDSVGRR